MNVEHCGASMSQQYIVAFKCYIAKVYQWSSCHVTAHREWYLAKQDLSVYSLQNGTFTITENNLIVIEGFYTRERFVLPMQLFWLTVRLSTA